MVIVIPYQERYNYLRLTLCTLQESLRGYEASILLYHTYHDVKKCDLDIFKEIDNILEFMHIRRRGEANLDYLIPMIINDAFMKTDEQFIILLDSDTIVHPEAIKMFLYMQESCANLGIGGLFNTARFPFVEINNDIGFGIKKQLGGFGLLINREAWLLYCANTFHSWDALGTLAISRSDTHQLYCSVNSYLEHVGMIGSHRYKDKALGDPMSIDRALNFFDE